MSDLPCSAPNRRTVIKNLGITSTSVAIWSAPVVSVMGLPMHAQASTNHCNHSDELGSSSSSNESGEAGEAGDSGGSTDSGGLSSSSSSNTCVTTTTPAPIEPTIPVCPAELTDEDDMDFVRTSNDYLEILRVDQYDPSPGYISEIKITWTTDVIADVRIEHRDPDDSLSITQTYGANMFITGPNDLEIAESDVTDTVQEAFFEFDNIEDFAGTSGATHEGLEVTDSGIMYIRDPDIIADFIGDGKVDFEVVAHGVSSNDAQGNVTTRVDTFAKASIKIEYSCSI